jgi:hypothetical protein
MKNVAVTLRILAAGLMAAVVFLAACPNPSGGGGG